MARPLRRLGVSSLGAHNQVRILARVLVVVGIACMLFALASCAHYYATNPPPEASSPTWDAESRTDPYIRAIVFWIALGAGLYTFRLGRFLYGRAPHRQHEP